MKHKYIPIDCGFHDTLLDRATRRSVIELVYLDADEMPRTKHIVIKDVYTKQKEEFLLMNDGEIIRLDQIVSVDGIEPPKNSNCHL